MKVIIASYDGHINSSGFNSWEEAREFVSARIPKDVYIFQNIDEYWTKFDYIEKRERRFIKHTWELNEVNLVKRGSS